MECNWDKYDSKKPAMRSQLATEYSNCLHICRGRNIAPASTIKRLNSLFRDKRKQIIATERARQSFSNRFDSLKIKVSVNFASDSVRKKKRESEARSSVRCWK